MKFDLDKVQANHSKRMTKLKHKNHHSIIIMPAPEKSIADLRDFRYESLNQNTMKSRRCGGKTSKTRKKESR